MILWVICNLHGCRVVPLDKLLQTVCRPRLNHLPLQRTNTVVCDYREIPGLPRSYVYLLFTQQLANLIAMSEDNFCFHFFFYINDLYIPAKYFDGFLVNLSKMCITYNSFPISSLPKQFSYIMWKHSNDFLWSYLWN